ncbi:MAG: universal stress protein UspA [Cyclobacteriaceae bacterium]|nr:MAG: universal stress protein UspA [Cyclobacteriaceae bacterium]
MKKILVPTDFSKEAGYALDAATNLAVKTGSELLLLHVVEGFVQGSFSTQGGTTGNLNEEVFTLKLLEKGKKDLLKLASSSKLKNINVQTNVKVGNPFHHIAKDILDHEADLVIMGSKGTSGYKEVLIGSNTERVVRHSKCPVITIKQPTDFGQITDVVFAADFIETEDNVAIQLKQLQNLLDAKLHLLKVDTPGNFESTRTIKKRIHNFVQRHGLENFTMEIYNESTEEDGIVYFAEDIDADMIALATHGRTGLRHLISGSIAEDVVNHAQRPVWTCKVN